MKPLIKCTNKIQCFIYILKDWDFIWYLAKSLNNKTLLFWSFLNTILWLFLTNDMLIGLSKWTRFHLWLCDINWNKLQYRPSWTLFSKYNYVTTIFPRLLEVVYASSKLHVIQYIIVLRSTEFYMSYNTGMWNLQ